MKKFVSVGVATIASILLILIIVFSMIGVVINDDTFINNEFTKLGVSASMGMSNADLVSSFKTLVDYMEGDADSIYVEVTVGGEKVEMFSFEQETTHMADVREIYTTIAGYRDVGALVALILFLFAAVVNFRMAPQRLAQGYLSGAFVVLLIFGFLGTWAAMDFSSFWTFFHETLFWNDLWLFDATESRMINMLPEGIFADIIGRVATYAGAIVGVLIVIAIAALVVDSPEYKRRKAARLAKKKQRQAAVAAKNKAKQEAKEAAEREKRIAERKAKKAAERRRAQAEAEAEERAQQARAKKKKKRAAAQTDEQPEVRSQKSARNAAPAKKKSDGAAKSAKKRPRIEDDTGFFDDDD